jgi:hypothetical protein
VEITEHGQDVQMFINDQHGRIITRQNSWNWSSSTVRWTGDSKESSCQHFLQTSSDEFMHIIKEEMSIFGWKPS